MSKENPHEDITNAEFISWRQMVVICLTITFVTQTLAQLVAPTAWLNYQMLAFIMATNLGAVILAILAQRSADHISKSYQEVFTPDFYHTVTLLSQFRGLVESEAAKDGKSISGEMSELAPKFYGLARKYVDVKCEEMGISPPDIEVLPADENDAPLFVETEHSNNETDN